MRTIFTLLAFFLFQTTLAQLRFGTYKITGETKDFGGGTLFSELIVKKDNSFTYKYLTSISCFLWYDSHGKWTINKDTLILTDSVLSYHPLVEFVKKKTTDDNRISILVKTKENKPIQGVKVKYLFKNSKDTLSGLTNAKGKLIIDTKDRIPAATETDGEYRTVDDVEIWIVYFSKGKKDQTTNTFSDLSEEMECVIDNNAENKSVIRTTYYKIDKGNLLYLSQRYNATNVRPGRYLFGDFKFEKE